MGCGHVGKSDHQNYYITTYILVEDPYSLKPSFATVKSMVLFDMYLGPKWHIFWKIWVRMEIPNPQKGQLGSRLSIWLFQTVETFQYTNCNLPQAGVNLKNAWKPSSS